MSKIMFVEDELSANVPRLLDLFEKILSPKEKQDLLDAENNPMGVLGSDVRAILAKNPVLEVFDSFPEALKHIKNLDFDAYDMFIFDRNLQGGPGYDVEAVRRFDRGFDEERYREKEGDYLALQLHLRRCDIQKKVYFYSAYRNMRFGATEIDQMVEYRSFFTDNFHDKGNPEELKKIIGNQQRARLVAEYRSSFSALHDCGIQADSALLELLAAGENPGGARLSMHFRSILAEILEYLKLVKAAWYKDWNENDPPGELIKKLHSERIPCHVIMFMGSINGLINQYVAHPGQPDSAPVLTRFAYQAALNELLEVIRWTASIRLK